MPEVRAVAPAGGSGTRSRPGRCMLPGVFNPLVARIAERAGFQAVYLSGAALSASLGLPDVGLVTLTGIRRRRPGDHGCDSPCP